MDELTTPWIKLSQLEIDTRVNTPIIASCP